MSFLRASMLISLSLGAFVCVGCSSDRRGGGDDDDGDGSGFFAGSSGGTDDDGSPGSSGAPSGPTGGGDGSAAGLCVDTINQHRASIGVGPLERWADAEACSDGEAASDAQTGQAHGAFGQCEEHAQNECPGWPGPPAQMIGGCLQMMWDEGPGEDFAAHGHYINMSSTQYTKVACGFHEGADGDVWSVQNFR